MVRLLRSYCNRERQAAHLEKLRAQAAAERVLRPESPTPVSKPAPKRLSAKANAGILADYATKMPIRAIARKYGVNEWTVHHRLKRAGVVKRPHAIQQDTINAVLSFRTEGQSNVEIAKGNAEPLVDSFPYPARQAGSFMMVSNWMGVNFPSLRWRRRRW